MGQKALGRLFDIGLAFAPQAVNNGADVTGKRIWMGDASGVTILVIAEAGTAGDDLDLDLQEHTAASGGTSRDLDIINEYFIKSETTLDNDESWVRVTQAAASEITDAGGGGTSAEEQQLVVFYVGADQLSDDCAWISVNGLNAGTNNDKLATAVYIKHDLLSQRAPANLPNLLNPGAADA
jgi:hypothetical protein